MKILIDTHSHTLVSGHAYNTINEMVLAAKEKGLEAIALTEHAPRMPGTTGEFYFQNLKVLPRQREGVNLLFGVELNILDENGNVDLEEWLCESMDIVIASIHMPGECYGGDKGIVANTNAYLNVIKKPGINIIGHPDDDRFPVDYDTIVSAAKEAGVLMELNNSSLHPNSFRANARENQLKYLEICKKYKAPITLGSDAHVDLDIGNFDLAYEVLKACDFPEELIVSTSFAKLLPFTNYGKKA